MLSGLLISRSRSERAKVCLFTVPTGFGQFLLSHAVGELVQLIGHVLGYTPAVVVGELWVTIERQTLRAGEWGNASDREIHPSQFSIHHSPLPSFYFLTQLPSQTRNYINDDMSDDRD